MCEISYTLVLIVACIGLSVAAPPPFITKCKLDDTKCLKESTQAAISIYAGGLPENKVEQLDPLFFDTVDASSPNLKFILSDLSIKGLKDCEAKKIQYDVEKSKLIIKLICSTNIDGNYEIKGQVLVLPIEGKGQLHVDLNSLEMNVDLDITNKTGDDGKIYWHIKSWQHTFDLKEKSDITFQNLFNGNNVLNQAVKELIATNGNDIIKEIGKPMIKVSVARVARSMNNFFKTIPVEDLILN